MSNTISKNTPAQQSRRVPNGIVSASLILLTILLTFGLFCQDAQADRIIRKRAASIDSVNIVEEGPLKVKYRREGSNAIQELDSSQVVSIEYDDAPDSYNQGLAFLASGEYENAVNSFQLAATEKSKNGWCKVYSDLHVAKAYRLWGAKESSRFSDAVAAYNKFRESHAESRFQAEALYELGLSQSGSGDAKGAGETFDKLQSWAFEQHLSVEWEVKALFAKAQAYLENGNPIEARSSFRRVKSFADSRAGKIDDDDALKARVINLGGQADLKEGEILILEKKFPDAQRYYENLLKDPSLTPTIKASATNGLGECQFAKGEFKDAQVTFARARVAYFNVSDEAARATYFLGRCCDELGSLEPGGARRAQDYYKEVTNYFDGTTWADQARGYIR